MWHPEDQQKLRARKRLLWVIVGFVALGAIFSLLPEEQWPADLGRWMAERSAQ